MRNAEFGEIMVSDEFDQEKIDQILLGDGSLRELRAFFPNSTAIYKHHARRMAELFPAGRTVRECECCHRHSAELWAVFDWHGVYFTAGTAVASAIGTALTITLMHHVFHFLMPSKQIEFSTSHGFCKTCFAQIERRKNIANVVKQLCLGLIVLAAMILASVVVFAALFLFPKPTGQTAAAAAIGVCAGLLCLVAGLFAVDCVVRWCLPKSLRRIAKPPFELVEFKES